MRVKYKPTVQIDTEYDYLYAAGRYEEAIDVMRVFLEECDRTKNPYGAMLAHISIATCYYCMGQSERAFQSILLYKKLCDEYGAQYEQYNLCHLQSLIYEYELNYKKAKESTEECIHLARSLNLPHELCINYSMLSYIHLMTEQYEDALTTAQDALAIAELHTSKDSRIQCHIHSLLSIAYVSLDRLPEAAFALEITGRNPFTQSSPLERSRYLYIQSLLTFKEGDIQHAVSLLTEAETLAFTTQNSSLLKRVYLQQAHAYEKLKNFELAYYYMKKYTQMMEGLYKECVHSKIEELDIQYNMSTLERLANIDSLSGVYTRHYLESACDQWLRTQDHICCVVFDVDDFKTINDEYGHLVGDEVIKAVGQMCRHVIQEEQTIVGRYGGDEFVILFRDFPEEHLMHKIGKLFQALTGMKITGQNYEIQFTVSMGMVSTTSVIAGQFKQLFQVADQALYMAKNQGKNQIVTLSNTNSHTNCSSHPLS